MSWKTIYNYTVTGNGPYYYGAELPNSTNWRIDQNAGEIQVNETTPEGKYNFKIWVQDQKGGFSLGSPHIANVNIPGQKDETVDVEILRNGITTFCSVEKVYVEFSGINIYTGDCTEGKVGWRLYDQNFIHVNRNFELVKNKQISDKDKCYYEYTGCNYPVYYERDHSSPKDCSYCGATSSAGYLKSGTLAVSLEKVDPDNNILKIYFDGRELTDNTKDNYANIYHVDRFLSDPFDIVNYVDDDGQRGFKNYLIGFDPLGTFDGSQILGSGGRCYISYDYCDCSKVDCNLRTPTPYPTCTVSYTPSATASETPTVTLTHTPTQSFTATATSSATATLPSRFQAALLGLDPCPLNRNVGNPWDQTPYTGYFARLLETGKVHSDVRSIIGAPPLSNNNSVETYKFDAADAECFDANSSNNKHIYDVPIITYNPDGTDPQYLNHQANNNRLRRMGQYNQGLLPSHQQFFDALNYNKGLTVFSDLSSSVPSLTVHDDCLSCVGITPTASATPTSDSNCFALVHLTGCDGNTLSQGDKFSILLDGNHAGRTWDNIFGGKTYKLSRDGTAHPLLSGCFQQPASAPKASGPPLVCLVNGSPQYYDGTPNNTTLRSRGRLGQGLTDQHQIIWNDLSNCRGTTIYGNFKNTVNPEEYASCELCFGQTHTATESATPSLTVSETPTVTVSETVTPTESHTSTQTETVTASSTHTPSQTSSGTPTLSASATPTVSLTDTPTATHTHSGSSSYSPTVTATASQGPTATLSRTITPSATATSTKTYTPTVTITPTVSPSYSPTRTATGTFSQTPTLTGTQSATASHTTTITKTPTATSSVTSTSTKTVTPTATSTHPFTHTSTGTVSVTPTITLSQSGTPTSTQTVSYTPSATWSQPRTPTLTVSHTPTISYTPTLTISSTPTATRTATETHPTSTVSYTLTGTVTVSATPTVTYTKTVSATPTLTKTVTSTHTPTLTFTHPHTLTATGTISHTPTYTVSHTPTYTVSHTLTSTKTRTSTGTGTGTSTATHTETSTVSHTPTLTHSSTGTVSHTPTLSHTPTYTVSHTPTYTVSHTPTYTVSHTPTLTHTASYTVSHTDTPTVSHTVSYTVSPTPTYTVSHTPTHTVSYTLTSTKTRTSTGTGTGTSTATHTETSTVSHTPTLSHTDTPTVTRSPSLTATSTATRTSTVTGSATPTQSISHTLSHTDTPTLSHTDTPTLTVSHTPTLTHTASYTV